MAASSDKDDIIFQRVKVELLEEEVWRAYRQIAGLTIEKTRQIAYRESQISRSGDNSQRQNAPEDREQNET